MQMCLGCNDAPATSTSEDGTVPLCAECASKIVNPRGVVFERVPSQPPVQEAPEPLEEEPPSTERMPVTELPKDLEGPEPETAPEAEDASDEPKSEDPV